MQISARPGWGGARANSGGPRPGAGRPRNPPPRIIQTRPHGRRWYVLRLQPHQEDRIVRELCQGETRPGFPSRPPFEVEYPFTFVAERSHPRFAQKIPMFAQYAFVAFTRDIDPWPSLTTCDGVHLMTTRSGTPLPLPPDFVEMLQADAPTRLRLPSRALTPFDVGMRIRIVQGPMAGQDGNCVECDGILTQIELSLLGRPVVVTLPRAHISSV